MNFRVVARVGCRSAPEHNVGKGKSPPRVTLQAFFVSILSRKYPIRPTFMPVRAKPVPLTWWFGAGTDRYQRSDASKKTQFYQWTISKSVTADEISCRPDAGYPLPCYWPEVSLFSDRVRNGSEVSKRRNFQGKCSDKGADSTKLPVNLLITGNIRWRPVRHGLRHAPFSEIKSDSYLFSRGDSGRSFLSGETPGETGGGSSPLRRVQPPRMVVIRLSYLESSPHVSISPSFSPASKCRNGAQAC